MSGQRNEPNAIDDRAIEWLIQRDRGALSCAAHAELDAWLAEDPRHAGAFIRAQAAWKALDRLQILSNHKEIVHKTGWLSRRRVLSTGGSAVALASAAAAIGGIWTEHSEIQTPLGEIRRVPLGDGSLLAVNTNSDLKLEITSEARRIVLKKGEVWFDVASDHKRPFIVTAGDIRVRAVGTGFSVRRHDYGADVLVTDGVVETWVAGAEDRKRIVAAGSKVFVSDLAGPSELIAASNQIDRTLAWRNGEVVLDGETVAEAADEFNRYNERKLTIDPALADKRLVGWFHTNQPETFARAAATTIGATVISSDKEIHLAPKSEQ